MYAECNSNGWIEYQMLQRLTLSSKGMHFSELARLQVRSRFSGHSFVNISLHSYACWDGPPCRDLGYRKPGSCLKRADFSHINERNRPARLWRTRSITFGTKGLACTYSCLCKIEKARNYYLVLCILHEKWRHEAIISRAASGLAHYRISHINPRCLVGASSLTGQPTS